MVGRRLGSNGLREPRLAPPPLLLSTPALLMAFPVIGGGAPCPQQPQLDLQWMRHFAS